MAAAAERARAARHPLDGGLHLPPRAGDRPGPPARAGGTGRRDPARPRAVPAGLARRPRDAADLAAAEGPGRLGRARRHRGAHHRPRPLHHRRADHRRQRDDRDLRRGAAAARRRAWPVGRGRHRARPGHRRRRRDLHRPVERRGARHLRGHPLRHRPQELDPDGDQRFSRQHRLRLRGHERAAVVRRHGAGPRVRLHPGDRHRGDAPLRRALVAGRPRARLRARLHPPGGRPHRRDRPGRRPRPRRSPTASPSRRCSPPSSSARPTGRAGPPSTPSPRTAPPAAEPPPTEPTFTTRGRPPRDAEKERRSRSPPCHCSDEGAP